MNDKHAAFRQTVTDKMFLGSIAFQALLVAAWFAAGDPVRGTVWAAVFLVVDAAIGYGMYRSNLRTLHQAEKWAREQHERDLRMERLAQEHDILQEDNVQRLAAIRTTGTDPGPGRRAAEVMAGRAERAAEAAAREAVERAARQTRLAEREARAR